MARRSLRSHRLCAGPLPRAPRPPLIGLWEGRDGIQSARDRLRPDTSPTQPRLRPDTSPTQPRLSPNAPPTQPQGAWSLIGIGPRIAILAWAGRLHAAVDRAANRASDSWGRSRTSGVDGVGGRRARASAIRGNFPSCDGTQLRGRRRADARSRGRWRLPPLATAAGARARRVARSRDGERAPRHRRRGRRGRARRLRRGRRRRHPCCCHRRGRRSRHHHRRGP